MYCPVNAAFVWLAIKFLGLAARTSPRGGALRQWLFGLQEAVQQTYDLRDRHEIRRRLVERMLLPLVIIVGIVVGLLYVLGAS